MLSIDTLTALEAVFSKESLDKGIFRLVKIFYVKTSHLKLESVDQKRILEILTTKKVFSKPEMVTIAFSVFGDEKIYKAFVESLSPLLAKAIERLVWVESMTDIQLSDYLKESILIEPAVAKSYTYGISYLNPDFFFFTVTDSKAYSSFNPPLYNLSIHPELKQIIANYYPKPKHFDFLPLDKIPETRYSFNAYPQILEELPRVISYYLHGSIKYSSNGRPIESSMGKMQKSCAIAEFYPKELEELSKMRCNLMAGLLYGFTQNDLDIDSVDIIKKLFQNNYRKSSSVQFILTLLKGWGFVNPDYELTNGKEEILLELLKDFPEKDWVSTANFLELIEYRSLNIHPITERGAENRLYFEKKLASGFMLKSAIDKNKYPIFIKDPFIKGTIFLFASFGLMEISFANVNTENMGETYYSQYDGLMYFRLTPLGAYIFGVTSTYEPPEVVVKNIITLSHDSLMIVAEGNRAIIDVMLGNYCEKMSSTRYKVTPQSFLKDCKNKKDVENKITLFKKTVNTSIPTFWSHFFKQLVVNASTIKINKTVQTYSLPPEEKDLHRLVAQDTVLKQFVLKGEGFNLIVPNDSLPKFKSRMKELGFVIE